MINRTLLSLVPAIRNRKCPVKISRGQTSCQTARLYVETDEWGCQYVL